jgi:hypothetical protein
MAFEGTILQLTHNGLAVAATANPMPLCEVVLNTILTPCVVWGRSLSSHRNDTCNKEQGYTLHPNFFE